MPGLDGPATAKQIPSQPEAEVALADLLFLCALASAAPIVMARIRDDTGRHSIVAHGLSGPFGRGDHLLVEAIRQSGQPLDLAQVKRTAPGQAVLPPLSMHWGYGVSNYDRDGEPSETIAILDRWPREVTKKENQVLAILARRLHFVLHPPGATPIPPAPDVSEPVIEAHPAFDLLSPRTPLVVGEDRTELPQLLRASEVAKLFNVTERTVLNWTANGRIPFIRTIGGHLRYRRPEILQLLDMQSRQTAD